VKRMRLLLAVGLLALGACAGAGALEIDPSAGSAPVRVSVIGDSITFLSRHDISKALAGGHVQADVVGRIGHTAAEVRSDVQAAARRQPDVVVLELGTNDVTRGVDLASFARTMTAYREAFPHACVLATTVSSHRGSTRLDTGGAAVNDWLMHNFTYVIDWNTREFAARQAGNDMVPVDDVHPNPAGQAVLAELDVAGVRACRRGRV
jgi:GDSL-like Lipase/Acylhydrolase family